jgi:hypothetical protein
MPPIFGDLMADLAEAQDQFAQRAAEEVGRAKRIYDRQDVRLVRRAMF